MLGRGASGGQETTCGSQFFSFIMGVPGMALLHSPFLTEPSCQFLNPYWLSEFALEESAFLHLALCLWLPYTFASS